MKHTVLFLVLIGFLGLSAIMLIPALHANNGQLTYTVDDAFIHLSIAKHVVRNGVWGVTPYEFANASSSPLWSLSLILLFGIGGLQIWFPLLLNLVFALLLLIFVYRVLWQRQTSSWLTTGVLILLITAVPLPALTLTGMEHIAHLLAMTGFVWCAARALNGETVSRPLWWSVTICAAALRYETLFAVLIVDLLLLLQRRWQDIAALTLMAILPLLIVGTLSVAMGGYPLPNSLLVKGVTFDLSTPLGVFSLLGLRSIVHLASSPALLILFVALLTTVFHRQNRVAFYVSLIALGTMLLHLQLAQTGSFYRYEGYLIGLALFALGLHLKSLPQSWTRPVIQAVVIGLLLIPILFWRGIVVLRETPTALVNNYQQHYQIAQFIGTFYSDQQVALNDIGAVTFYADIQLFDAAGLGSDDLLLVMMRQGRQPLSPAQLQDALESIDIEVGVFSQGWVTTPDDWILVGAWMITNNVIAASDTVVFYADDDASANVLRMNLCRYSTQLPAQVVPQIDCNP